ncbi:uncharacterized protein LOC131841570 [Achroia grisella]|uniref:uncharacterized protein LOC131841570 n=1 Tax=Achroia grisella TaxID=688607 RepID=UPI0027D261BE|nr:uncharacterized protein LOC131841570 [Achroia grisella]
MGVQKQAFAFLVIAVTSAAALGSGPYLPSGWRPKGPAFYLPSETQQKPEDNPLKDVIFQETEASGSDFLREYGPPKNEEIIQDITRQSLPEVITEQAFAVIEARFNDDVKEISSAVTENAEIRSDVAVEVTGELRTSDEVAATESQVVEERTTESANEATETAVKSVIQGKSLNIDIEASIGNTEDDVQTAVDATERSAAIIVNNAEVAAVEARIQKEVEQEVNTVVEGVKNIEEAIVNIENEKVLERQIAEGKIAVKSAVESSGSLAQAPEGFLEYGPPGFREYGPPKGDIVPLSGALVENTPAQEIENNETRRRRFSPKLRIARKH